jgi:small multidrug resistance family-3 protein
VPGIASFSLFAYLLTPVEAERAGRTYATHGGIYILSALSWLCVAEGVRLDRWDVLGVSVRLFGTGIILWGRARHSDPRRQLSAEPAF